VAAKRDRAEVAWRSALFRPAPNSFAVADTTLRLTTLQAGGLFDNMPGDYSDFIRLATFNPDGWGTCQ
jgi:hypothetical protein